jgi:hypothetical protein
LVEYLVAVRHVTPERLLDHEQFLALVLHHDLAVVPCASTTFPTRTLAGSLPLSPMGPFGG